MGRKSDKFSVIFYRSFVWRRREIMLAVNAQSLYTERKEDIENGEPVVEAPNLIQVILRLVPGKTFRVSWETRVFTWKKEEKNRWDYTIYWGTSLFGREEIEVRELKILWPRDRKVEIIDIIFRVLVVTKFL